MNRILGSRIVRIAALVAGYFCALSAVTSLSPGFRLNMASLLFSRSGERFSVAGYMTADYLAMALFALCAIVFFLSVLKSERRGARPPWRRIDWTLLVALTFCFCLICVNSARHDLFWGSAFVTQLVALSVFTYLAVMAMLGEIAARIRDGQILSTVYWVKFFKLYPVTRPVGLLMLVLLACNVWLVFGAGLIDTVYTRRLDTPLFLLGAFTLVALTYFCSFVLSLATDHERAAAEKVKAERFKSELITNVSHDIRTPLTTVINYVDLLKALPVENKEFAEYTAVLDKKTTRLKTLIDDLMEASKAGTGNVGLDMADINLGEIIGQVAGEFEEQFLERELVLVIRQPDGAVSVRADSRHLWRALENIFNNAAKYSLPGTRIFADIVLREDHTVFSLKNTSENPIELPADALTEQFIRGDRARQTEGSGLGLYIAKSLVELMGGLFVIRATGDLFECEITFSGPASG